MRKLVSIATLAVVLAVPAAALAANIKHEGSVVDVPSATVGFTVTKQSGGLEEITDMVFRRVPFTCDDGSSGTITGTLPEFPVEGKSFTRRGSIEGVGIENGRLRVAGKFRRAGRVAEGKVRFSFKRGTGAGCGTTDVAWETAKA